MSTDAVIALVTCPSTHAEPLAQTLVEGRLAACVNLLPGVRSVYRWEGEVKKDDEVLLLIKTAADRIEALRQAVLKHHPYELPEFITVNVTQAHAPYLQWLLDSTRLPH